MQKMSMGFSKGGSEKIYFEKQKGEIDYYVRVNDNGERVFIKILTVKNRDVNTMKTQRDIIRNAKKAINNR